MSVRIRVMVGVRVMVMVRVRVRVKVSVRVRARWYLQGGRGCRLIQRVPATKPHGRARQSLVSLNPSARLQGRRRELVGAVAGGRVRVQGEISQGF